MVSDLESRKKTTLDMAIRIINLIICVISFAMYSCEEMLEDDPFTLEKTSNNSMVLRIDGYFYETYGQDSDVNVLIFYRDGVMIDGGGGNPQSVFEDLFRDGSFKEIIKDQKDCWGLYTIDDKTILVENIIPIGGLHRIASTRYGEIINDSTINFYKKKESWSDFSEAIDDTFHFKRFSQKPDSINVWIE
jgi:hypothetical protein